MKNSNYQPEMKSEGSAIRFLVKHVFMALLIFALAGVVAIGKSPDKTKTKSVTFGSDVTVNGTLVKAGTYDVKFDEETGDLSIMKNGKVIANAAANLRERTTKVRGTEVETQDNELVRLSFSGARQDIVLGSTPSPAAATINF